MGTLFRVAYLEALVLWAPLLLLAGGARKAPTPVRVAMVASAMAAANECFMTFVWEPTVTAPIRIDILLLLPVLGFINAISGGIMLYSGVLKKNQEQKRDGSLIVMGLLCLSVPMLAIVGWVDVSSHMRTLQRSSDDGRRLRFEAGFRDDASQKRFFGELASDSSPWAGYYLGSNQDPRYQYLIINDAGKIWLYGQKFYVTEVQGHQDPENPNQFGGAARQESTLMMDVSLERQADNSFTLRVKHSNNSGYEEIGRDLVFTKTPPPRFPVLTSLHDEVKFMGVFSAKYGIHDNSFWVVQVWLWESNGRVWGRYLRNNYTKGNKYDFVAAQNIEPRCAGPCAELNLSFLSEKWPVSLRRINDNQLKVQLEGVYEDVILSRGEIVPGFIFDLAPLGSAKQNRDWLLAVENAEPFVKWDLSAQ